MKQDLLTPMPSGEAIAITSSASSVSAKTVGQLLEDNGYAAKDFPTDIVVELTATVNCHWTHAETPVVTSGNPLLTAWLTRQVRVNKEHKIAAISFADDGSLYIHPCLE